MSAMSNTLNYASMKRKSVAARSYRAQFRSQSGLTFNSNSSFTIHLGTMARSYLDLNNMYLQFQLSHVGAASTGILDYSAYSLFSRITIQSGNGAILEDVNYLNIYNTLLLQSQVSEEFAKGYGVECIGNAGRPGCPFGIAVPGNATPKTICIPLISGLFGSANRLLPLDTSAPISVTFYIDAKDKFLVKSGATALDDIKIQNPMLVGNITELSESTQALLNESLGQLSYNLNYTGIVSTVDSKNAGAGTHVTNLAFRNSSLNKITLVMQAQSLTTAAVKENNFSISNRSTANLNEFSYFVNGIRYPQQKITMDANKGYSEVHTENILANRTLMDPTHHSSLNFTSNQLTVDAFGTLAVARTQVDNQRTQIPVNSKNFECERGFNSAVTLTDDATLDTFKGDVYGTFYSTLSFQTFGDGEGIISGVNTLGATTQFEGVFGDTAEVENYNLYFFGEVEKILSLDPLTMSWIVSD